MGRRSNSFCLNGSYISSSFLSVNIKLSGIWSVEARRTLSLDLLYILPNVLKLYLPGLVFLSFNDLTSEILDLAKLDFEEVVTDELVCIDYIV